MQRHFLSSRGGPSCNGHLHEPAPSRASDFKSVCVPRMLILDHMCSRDYGQGPPSTPSRGSAHMV